LKPAVILHRARKSQVVAGLHWIEWATDERTGETIWSHRTSSRKDPACPVCPTGTCSQVVLRCDAWAAETVLHAQPQGYP
jgi:hypothetical protein